MPSSGKKAETGAKAREILKTFLSKKTVNNKIGVAEDSSISVAPRIIHGRWHKVIKVAASQNKLQKPEGSKKSAEERRRAKLKQVVESLAKLKTDSPAEQKEEAQVPRQSTAPVYFNKAAFERLTGSMDQGDQTVNSHDGEVEEQKKWTPKYRDTTKVVNFLSAARFVIKQKRNQKDFKFSNERTVSAPSLALTEHPQDFVLEVDLGPDEQDDLRHLVRTPSACVSSEQESPAVAEDEEFDEHSINVPSPESTNNSGSNRNCSAEVNNDPESKNLGAMVSTSVEITEVSDDEYDDRAHSVGTAETEKIQESNNTKDSANKPSLDKKSPKSSREAITRSSNISTVTDDEPMVISLFSPLRASRTWASTPDLPKNFNKLTEIEWDYVMAYAGKSGLFWFA